MYKEIIICVTVIALVVIGNIVTQNNTNRTVETMSNNLNILREEMIKEVPDKEQIDEKMKKTEQTWEEEYEKMAYYIEHNELEKVKTELAKVRADIETKEYSMAIENLDNCVFILWHIKDKSAFKVVNIF